MIVTEFIHKRAGALNPGSVHGWIPGRFKEFSKLFEIACKILYLCIHTYFLIKQAIAQKNKKKLKNVKKQSNP